MRITGLTRRLCLAAALSAGLLAHSPFASAQPVQVALGDALSVETLSVAIALERAKARGFDYRLTAFAREELAIQAVINGQAQIGVATPFAVMQRTRAPIRNLMQLTRLVFFPVADRSIRTWQDLNNQTMTFHARGSGTEAIGNILARRNNITFGQRNYVAGSENRVVAMMNGQIRATILDLANKNILLQRAGDRFHVLPGLDNPASDEVLFVRQDWLAANTAAADLLVEEFYKLWMEMGRNPAIIEQERARLGLLRDLPREVLADVTRFHTQGVQEGVFSRTGGNADTIRADFEFYLEGGQLQGPLESLRAEDFWEMGPLERARRRAGS
jgi:NitT/TauT family transport system substrate-binding protein